MDLDTLPDPLALDRQGWREYCFCRSKKQWISPTWDLAINFIQDTAFATVDKACAHVRRIFPCCRNLVDKWRRAHNSVHGCFGW